MWCPQDSQRGKDSQQGNKLGRTKGFTGANKTLDEAKRFAGTGGYCNVGKQALKDIETILVTNLKCFFDQK